MFCKYCGKQIDDDSVFCSYCGTKQSVFDQPIVGVESNSANSESKTVNVNLSFGRPQSNKVVVDKTKVEKYDATYQKESDATAVGVIILIVSFIFLLFGGVKDPSLYYTLAIVSSIGRIMITVWCVNIAKRQNREAGGWGFFAFFFPSIALIIIGQLEKLKRDIRSDTPQIVDPPNELRQNPNNLPDIKLPVPDTDTLGSMRMDSFTLKHFVKAYKRYVKERNELFPLYASLELNRRGEKFTEEIISSLASYSNERGFNSFDELLESYKEDSVQ